MADPMTLTTLILAGAAVAGTEAVKEGTKDAYRNLKEAVGNVFGPRASKALVKVEDTEKSEEGRQELDRYVGNDLDADEAAKIQPFAEALIRALKDDQAAAQVAHSRVGLDIEAGGNAIIRNIQGAREIAAKVRAKKDVTVDGLRMDNGRDLGK